MVEVRKMFPLLRCKTELWVSDHVLEHMDRCLDKKSILFLEKLKYFAEHGFEIGEHTRVIKNEGSGVYRLGIKLSLFRILGFYEDGRGKTSFIGVDSIMKRDTPLSKSDRKAINSVARIRSTGEWRKVYEHGV